MPIRQPTTREAQYAWHSASLVNNRTPVDPDQPQCGWFRCRLVRGGPWVPARIWMVQVVDEDTGELTEPEWLRCEVNGQSRDVFRAWERLASNPIPRDRYEQMLDFIDWAGSNDPMHPVLNPTRPVDLSSRPVGPRGVHSNA
ncbi:MAG: hypothetical protein AAF674_16795 [Pseudomonadota bacterium]